jgi:hypothetical protein
VAPQVQCVLFCLVSSDPWADLQRAVRGLAEAADRLLDEPKPRAGAPILTECGTEPFAGEWCPKPNRDAFLRAGWLGKSAIDHLLAYAELLTTDDVILALSTVSRGAMEAACAGVFLMDPTIDGRARVIRNMNDRLDGYYEQNKTYPQGIKHPAPERLLRAAKTLGFDTKQGPSKRLFLSPGPVEITTLVNAVLGDKLGELQWRELCAVAHSAPHGIMRHFGDVEDDATQWADGLTRTRVRIDEAATIVAAPVLALKQQMDLHRYWFGLAADPTREEVLVRETLRRLTS